MKVVADTFNDAGPVLRELVDFKQTAENMLEQSQPYSKIGKGRALPVFIKETSVALAKLMVNDFSVSFPRLSVFIKNGYGRKNTSADRIHNACFNFDKAQRLIVSAHYVLTHDKIREDISDILRGVVGDICIYIAIQYQTYDTEEIVVRSVWEYCEQYGITPDVFHGVLLSDLDRVGKVWNAYEAVSPLYDDFYEYDPAFLEECASNNYELPDAVALKLIRGELTQYYVRSVCIRKQGAVIESNTNPIDMIDSMVLSVNGDKTSNQKKDGASISKLNF